MPLVNKQIIEAVCDICGAERTKTEEIPEGGKYLTPVIPKGWWELVGFIFCPKHTSVTIHYEVGEKIKIEDCTSG
jgi:hypothetical protein